MNGQSSNINTSQSTHSRIFIGSALFGLILLTSCSNEPFSLTQESQSVDLDHISFSVRTSEGWHSSANHSPALDGKGQESKAVHKVNGVNQLDEPLKLTSAGSDKPLYLFSEEIDGISLIGKRNGSMRSGNATRSSLATSENISSFGVFAAQHPDGFELSYKPDYMYNVEVTRQNSWTPVAEYLWPANSSLHITAYHPFQGELTEDRAEGIVSLPDAEAAAPLEISWVTPSAVADQQDLMWATPKDAAASPCELTFNHALSAIKFVAGAELAPCTVKKIEITDVLTSGTLNLENGEWKLLDSRSDFAVEPSATLAAAEGSAYVATNTPITSDSETLLLLPQTLSDTSEIILTMEVDGTEYTFRSSLSGAVWNEGKTTIYRLSANPVSDSLILDVLDADGNSVSLLESHYTGGDLKYSVRSSYTPAPGEVTQQIPWKAEFIDDDGNVIDRPQWISSFSLSGDGDSEEIAPTVLQTPVFAAMSDDTRQLRGASNINSSSGFSPYNLSNSTGGPAVQNTANTYIISAPGSYSIPLVYGNAIKGGATNESAYKWSTHTRNVLANFINHLGSAITDPYIYNNSGCTPEDAALVWEGQLCLVNNVRLSEDKHRIEFEVPSEYICQGNAMIAVRDSKGEIMWSWQLWVTPHPADEDLRTFAYNNHQYEIMTRNVGEISGGDDAYFAAQSVKVRFSQEPVPGISPKSIVITINRDAKHVKTPFCYSFYQWGRKDPMRSYVKEWYDAGHEEISLLPAAAFNGSSLGDDYITEGILNPGLFMTATHDIATNYVNLWNVKSTNADGIKSIYDPSPAGFKMPGIMFRAFALDTDESAYTVTYQDTNPSLPRLSFALPDGNLDMALLGYLQSGSGENTGVGINGSVWTNLIGENRQAARCFQFGFSPSQEILSQFVTDPLFMGFGVRPVKDK